MRPGVTMVPGTSMTRRASSRGISGATRAILPPSTARSSAPLRFCDASITVPPLRIKSYITGPRSSLTRFESIAQCPIDSIGERPAIEIGAQIGAEQIHSAMLTKIVGGGHVRRDDNAFIVPQAAVGLAFEFADIHVQGNAAEFAVAKRGDQRFLIDDFTACDIGNDGVRLHRREGFAANQIRGLWGPLTTARHEIALRQKRVQALGA